MKHKLTLLNMLIFFTAVAGYAMDYMSIIDSMSANGATFNEITQVVDEAWDGQFQGKHSGRKQYERWKFYHSSRLDVHGRLVNAAKSRWDEYYTSKKKSSVYNKAGSDFSGNWTSLGKTAFNHYPQGYSGGMGRVNCIAFDPANDDIIYIGTPGGGLWRSFDGGDSWDPMVDGMPRLGISGIAIDPNTPESNRTIYILTGDGDGKDTQSLGVYKSDDNGSTWMSTGLGSSIEYGYKLIMHPSNSNVLYAATAKGIYKTESGGLSWAFQSLPGFIDWDQVTDIEFNTANPEVLYATTMKSSVYTTINGGQNWTKLSGQVLPSEADVYEIRSAVAVTPANPDYIYILYGAILTEFRFGGLYRSTDGGLTFTLQSNYPNILGGDKAGLEVNGQSNYDLALAVSPLNPNEVFVGGINSWKSVDGGVSWANTAHWVEYSAGPGNYTHADYHAFEFDSDHNLYCGTDGGIYKSTDMAENWANLSFGLEITQFYRIGGKPNNPNIILGGAQDNGSMLMDETNTMHQWFGGDGFECMFSPDQEGTFYGSYQYGGIFKTVNGGESRYTITPRDETGELRIGKWLTPYTLDPNNSDVIYAGYNELYKSENGGSSWTDISNGVVDPQSKFEHIRVSKANADVIYALKSMNLYRTTDGGASWSYITEPIPQNYRVQGFTIDPNDIDKIWAYNALGVYKTANGGATWDMLSTTGLPNQWKNTIVFQEGSNDGVYLGTDAGIFYIDNNMSSWLNFSNGLVNVEIYELEINYMSNKLRAATYGRGVWESDLYINCDDGLTISIPNAVSKSGRYSKAIGTSYIIEAENYESTTGTFDDSPFGGPGFGVNSTGSNINYVNTNDEVFYNLPSNIESGVYQVDYYISTTMDGAAIALSIDNGSPVMTYAVTNNHQWDDYRKMTASKNITLQQGVNTNITLKGAGTSTWEWNLDRIVLTKVDEITIPVNGISLTADSLSLEKGESYQLIATIEPENATNKNITWATSNNQIARVENGLVTALSSGEAIISATTQSGGHVANCTIVVAPADYIITFEAENRTAYGTTFAIYQSVVGVAVEGESGQMGSFQLPQGFQGGEYRVEYFIGSAIEGGIVEFNADNTQGAFIGPINTLVPNFGTWDSFEWVEMDETIDIDPSRNSSLFIRAQGPAGKVWNLDKFRLVRLGDSNIAVESMIANSETEVTKQAGIATELRIKITPAYASNTNIIWTTSDENVAPLPININYNSTSGIASGIVITGNPGDAVITATSEDGGFTVNFNIHVNEPVVPVTGVSLSDHHEVLNTGEHFQLTASISPSTASNPEIIWSTNNEQIATVSSTGMVTAHSAGQAVIKVTTLDGGHTDSCTITVPWVVEYTVEAESYSATGGTVNDAVWGGPGFGFNNNGSTINWGNTGDWVDYFIAIENAGRYELTYMIATPLDGPAIEFSVNGIAYQSDPVPNTGDWEVYQPLTSSKNYGFNPGNYTLRLRGVGTHGWEWNLDKFSLTRIDDVCVPNTFLKAYHADLPGTFAGPMPGLIEQVEEEEFQHDLPGDNEFADAFAFYPNPADSKVTVAFKVVDSKPVSIQIMNVLGEVKASIVNHVLNEGSYEINYDLNKLSAGMYLVKYQHADTYEIQKLIIE